MQSENVATANFFLIARRLIYEGDDTNACKPTNQNLRSSHYVLL